MLNCFLRAGANLYTTIRFVIADYNFDVLRLVTLPNLLLTWAEYQNELQRSSFDHDEDDLGLDITENLLSSFKADLAQRNIEITAISGAWSPEFVALAAAGSPQSNTKTKTLVLASETIYSPDSLKSFCITLEGLISGSKADSSSKALVAAKYIYFGVGGGVEEFVARVRDLGLDAESRVVAGGEGGLRRVVVSVRQRH